MPLKAELERLKGRLPSQSHAMMDVDYHFANLWFAGQSENWPLAQFYLDETRSHLHWVVRIIPVRRIPGGEIDLRGLLETVDKGSLEDVAKAVADKDAERFVAAYRHTIEGCYSCHKASAKPYLRPRIPEQPVSRIISLDPAATWPSAYAEKGSAMVRVRYTPDRVVWSRPGAIACGHQSFRPDRPRRSTWHGPPSHPLA